MGIVRRLPCSPVTTRLARPQGLPCFCVWYIYVRICFMANVCMKLPKLNADDRRELLQLLQEEHGSKAAALSVFNGLTTQGQIALLMQLRRKRLEAAGQRPLPLDKPSEASSGRSVPVRKPKSPKVPYSLLLPQDDLDALRALADEQDVTVSHLIRRAIAHALRNRRF